MSWNLLQSFLVDRSHLLGVAGRCVRRVFLRPPQSVRRLLRAVYAIGRPARTWNQTSAHLCPQHGPRQAAVVMTSRLLEGQAISGLLVIGLHERMTFFKMVTVNGFCCLSIYALFY